MSPSGKKVALVILDGWGIGDHDQTDAIYAANTPFMDQLLASEACAELNTTGEMVGLPKGQMGNSEVGHMNIGAGRIVFQDLARINKAVTEGSLAHNATLQKALDLSLQGRKLHFIGLVSHGGVHSSQAHLHALLDVAEKAGVPNYYVHAFTDGRDTDPHSGAFNIAELEKFLANKNGKLASVVGRYYAMDRDKRWERTRKAYDLLVNGGGTQTTKGAQAMRDAYTQGITDEFLEPTVIMENGQPIATIEAGDVVVCFNFRTDRCRQISEVLTQKDHPDHGMKTLDLHYFTMTQYDDNYHGVEVLFDKEAIGNTLGEVLGRQGLQQYRMAETEKYPHVTFFFSGGREEPFSGEKRILVNSPKVATYDLQPEMSAPELTEKAKEVLSNSTAEFVCLNFANPDMVGHTGVFNAIMKAVETTDQCLQQVVECGKQHGWSFIIIADHGNADKAVNPDGSPNTAHSTNPVPMVVLDPDPQKVRDGILADIAPTVLELLGFVQPTEMTGRSLLD